MSNKSRKVRFVVTLTLGSLLVATSCAYTRAETPPPPVYEARATLKQAEDGKRAASGGADVSVTAPADAARQAVVPTCVSFLAHGDRAQRSSGAVLRLERIVSQMESSDWATAETLYGAALCRAADVLATEGAASADVAKLRHLGSEVAQSPKLDPTQPSRVKRGLRTAADALALVFGNAGAAERHGERAHAAVERISDERLLSQQRAAVQDAYRVLTVGLRKLSSLQSATSRWDAAPISPERNGVTIAGMLEGVETMGPGVEGALIRVRQASGDVEVIKIERSADAVRASLPSGPGDPIQVRLGDRDGEGLVATTVKGPRGTWSVD